MIKQSEELSIEETIARTERFGWCGWLVAGLLAVVVYVAQVAWEFPWMHPSVWNDAVVAAGIRPATQVMPGYCAAIIEAIYSLFGVSGGERVLRVGGHLLICGFAACTYSLLLDWLAYSMRMRPQFSRRRMVVMHTSAAFGAFAFVCADPVWTAGQCLSETSILLLLTLLSLKFFFAFLQRGKGGCAYLGALFLGLLAAESPIGLLLTLLFLALAAFINRAMPFTASTTFNLPTLEVGKWLVSFLYLVSIVCGIAFNSMMYVHHNGVEAIGETIGSIPIAYLHQYWRIMANLGSFGAWILWLGACITPFMVVMLRFPDAADEEQFLSYGTGATIFFCGLIAASQFTFLSVLWFWKHIPMESQYMLALGLLCAAAALAVCLTILCVDAFCRDHERLARQFLGDQMEDKDDGDGQAAVGGTLKTLRGICTVVIPVFLLVMIIPSRARTSTREMLEVIRDAVNEIVDENEGAKFIFTDGNLDAAIELESARRGTPVNCFSMISDGSPMSVYLRTRGLGTDKEDLFSFRFDTAMGMRGWIHDKPEKLRDCSALMGFDLWRRDGKPLPPMGGMLSRPMGFKDEPTRQEGVRRAHELADRVLDIVAKSDGTRACTDRDITEAFQIVQWRLARMCLYRSEACDAQGKTQEAILEADRSEALNDANSMYKDLVRSMERISAAMVQKLTPREGLQLSMVRADFTTGKIYAEKILTADKDDTDANFVMGMYYLKRRQFSRAEEYLKRCLVRCPNEPAVFNNLAMIQIEQQRYEEARDNIDKALKIIPGSAEVLDTKKTLEKAIKATEKKR